MTNPQTDTSADNDGLYKACETRTNEAASNGPILRMIRKVTAHWY